MKYFWRENNISLERDDCNSNDHEPKVISPKIGISGSNNQKQEQLDDLHYQKYRCQYLQPYQGVKSFYPKIKQKHKNKSFLIRTWIMETSLAPSPIANVLEPIPFEILTTTSDFCSGVTLQQSTAEHFEAIWMNFSVSFLSSNIQPRFFPSMTSTLPLILSSFGVSSHSHDQHLRISPRDFFLPNLRTSSTFE